MVKGKLLMERQDGGGGTLVKVSGVIDADISTAEFGTNLGIILIVDLGGVERITSFGVREWTLMMARVQTGWIGFVNCPPIVVTQFNSVADFGKSGQIVTMFLPFVCDACGKECEQLLDLRERFEVVESSDPPTMPCPVCGETASFDDLPENYFSFVRAQGQPRPSEAAARIIAGKLDAVQPLRVEKEVDGNLTGAWLSGNLDGSARLKRVLDGIQGDAVIELSGLTGLNEEGAGKLVDLLAASEFTPYLARVPAARLSLLLRGREQALAYSLVSVLVEATCSACKAHLRIEMFSEKLQQPHVTAICEHCYAEVKTSLAEEHFAAAKSVRCADVPRDVKHYLDSHPVGYLPSEKSKSNPLAIRSEQYQVLQCIGRGGMAEVFLARKRGVEGFEKLVVLKRMLPNLMANDYYAKMFLQEARTAARINHQNVVQIFDLGIDNGHYFIAMEYVKGWDLAVLVRAARRLGRRFSIPVTCKLVAELCAGLYAAHSVKDDNGQPAPVVHRDVSPHNALVSTDGLLKLTDFGISKTHNEGEVQTQVGVVKGKVPYMAPEQLDHSLGMPDHRVDVYQAGVVMAELVLGYSPFQLDSEYKSIDAILKNDVPDIARVRADCPPEVIAVIRKALARHPRDRYQTAREFQQALLPVVALGRKPLGDDEVVIWLTELESAALKNGHIAPPALTPTANEPFDASGQTEIMSRSKPRGRT